MYFLILSETNPMSMKETGPILIKLILFFTTFLLISMIIVRLTNKTNYLTEVFLNKINTLLELHARFNNINKYKLKFKTKPWISPGLEKLVPFKNKLQTKFIKMKNPIKKLKFARSIKSVKTCYQKVNESIFIYSFKITEIIRKILRNEEYINLETVS